MRSLTQAKTGTFIAGRLDRVEEEGDGELVMMVMMATGRRDRGGEGGAHVRQWVVRSTPVARLIEHVVGGESLCWL